uniref:Uncharacterized protein n=1 Tax=Oryza brachyantha TaxID=4533 RepID=J3N461_ORYBR
LGLKYDSFSYLELPQTLKPSLIAQQHQQHVCNHTLNMMLLIHRKTDQNFPFKSYRQLVTNKERFFFSTD